MESLTTGLLCMTNSVQVLSMTVAFENELNGTQLSQKLMCMEAWSPPYPLVKLLRTYTPAAGPYQSINTRDSLLGNSHHGLVTNTIRGLNGGMTIIPLTLS